MKALKWYVLLSLMMSIAWNGWAEETIRLSAGPWPPYTGEDLENYGIAAHIVSEAFALEGVTVEYKFVPWKRAFEEAKSGKLDGSILWRRTAERERDFYYSDQVGKIDIVFFHLKSYTFDWKTIDDLDGVRIGTVRGFKYDDAFDAAAESGTLNVEYVATQVQNLRKMVAGRINITPIVLESGYATIREGFSAEEATLFTHHATPLAEQSLHLILSKKVEKNTKMLELFNKGLQQLKESGRFDELNTPPATGK